MLHVHERPGLDGWIYPCSVDDLKAKLATIPPADLEGLRAVVLVPSTRRASTANASYCAGEKLAIYIYSHPASLEFKQPAHLTMARAERGLSVELEYGMKLVRRGARIYSQWAGLEDLRDFIVNHVLLHEVGHHVMSRARARRGYPDPLSSRVSEQFAEDYAMRLNRRSDLL